jgi:citrate synthase
MSQQDKPVTRLCTHTLTSLHYRDANLVDDLLGKKTFTEVMLMQILGRTRARWTCASPTWCSWC